MFKLQLSFAAVMFMPMMAFADMANPPAVPLSANISEDQQKQNYIKTQTVLISVQKSPVATPLVPAREPVRQAVMSEIKPLHPQYNGFLSAVSPDHQYNPNMLALVRVPTQVPDKDKINFVFLMNGLRPSQRPSLPSTIDQRTRLHMMWTGSKKFFVNQQVHDDEYPVDVSMANYEDGYAQGEWNMVTPSKKPHEVDVTLLWRF